MTAVGLLCAGCGAANQNRTTSANAASVRPVWKGYKNADGSDYIAPKTNDGSWDRRKDVSQGRNDSAGDKEFRKLYGGNGIEKGRNMYDNGTAK